MNELQSGDSDIIRDISPNDEMFKGRTATTEALARTYQAHYFTAGRGALECIDLSLQAARKVRSDIRNLLDLPCGHGRVLRFLKTAFPLAKISACDLTQEAVDYCALTFGAIPCYSDIEPAKIPLIPESFDLIWVGSLFTHLDAPLWGEFMSLFHKLLVRGGLLVFSTHGRSVYDKYRFGKQAARWRNALLSQYEQRAFGYVHTAPSGHYGISIAEPGWVLGQIARFDEFRLVHFCEKSWDHNQDIFACVREPGWRGGSPLDASAGICDPPGNEA
jgi:SAM-dependent methyltransferase